MHLRLAIASIFVTAVARGAAADVLNPATYTSPSGKYELFVGPGASDGSGPARYRLTRGGELVWARERAFSLWEAEVTDGGHVVGYAYEGGVRNTGHHGTAYNGLSIVILAPNGRELLHDPASSHGEVLVNSWAAGDSPSVWGLLVDPKTDRVVVRVPTAEGGSVIWWTYRLSTGEKTGDIVPEHPERGGRGFLKEIFADLVPGTALTFVHWYDFRYVDDRRTNCAVLSLLSPDGDLLWHLDLPGEYDGLGEDWNWHRDLVEPGIEQASVQTRGFGFHSYSPSRLLVFELEEDTSESSGWRVVDGGQFISGPPVGPKAPAEPEIESVELEHLGVIELGTPSAQGSPVRDLVHFAIDAAGNIGFIDRRASATPRFVLVDPTGATLSDFALELPRAGETGQPRAVPVTRDCWVLLRHSYEEGIGTQAWWLDAGSGVLEAIAGFTSGSIDSLAPTGDGGFMTLVSHHMEYTIQDELNRYDHNGALVWNRREPGYGQGFSYRAATWVEGAGMAALTGDTIEFFGVDGQHLRSLAVADVLQGEPNYPSGLSADAGGGLILDDSGGSPPIYRIDAGGTVVARFRPEFSDGRVVDLRGYVQVAPDGTLWATDGYSLLRLSPEGVVTKTLGPQPGENSLEEVRALTVDSAGSIYAVNGCTAAVHVFDGLGAPLRLLEPLPTDFATGGWFGSITVDGDGNVYYRTGAESSGAGLLGFSAEGERLGFEDLDVGRNWLFKPGTRERWVPGYEKLYLVDADGHTTKTIEKRPNGDWLQSVDAVAVAPSGAVAVVAGPGFGARGPTVLCIYAANGRGIKTIELSTGPPQDEIAFDGSRVVTVDNGAVYLHDVVDGSGPRKFVLPGAGSDQQYWSPTLPPDGTELWLRATDSSTLVRYKLP